MSHFTSISTQINDLNALEVALRSMNLSLLRNVNCRYYNGTERKQHVAKLPGRYDVAFEENRNGTYSIVADFYYGDVAKTIGVNGSILLRQYAIEKVKIEAAKLGCRVYSTNNPNVFKLMEKNGSGGKVLVEISEDGNITFKSSGFKGKSCMKFESLEKALGEQTSRKFTAEYYETEKVAERQKEQY